VSIQVHMTRGTVRGEDITVRLNDSKSDYLFSVITLGHVEVFLHDRAECDALVKAALAARDLLPEPVPDPATLNDALAEVAP